MMDKIQRMILLHVPYNACNLHCKYCYITQQNKWNDKIYKFKYDAKHIRKALSIERLGGICYINLCADGETLLCPEIVDVIEELLYEGHYIEIITNGTVNKRFDEIIKLPKTALDRLIFKFSFHYEELIRLNKMNDFIMNVSKVRIAGCSFTVELTTFDELISKVDDIKQICTENFGALCHLTVGRDDTDPTIPIASKYSIEDYKYMWSQFSSDMFVYKLFHKNISTTGH